MTDLSAEVFKLSAVPDDVTAFNEAMAGRLGGLPDMWDVGVEQARSGGFMPTPPPSERALDIRISDTVSLHVVPS